MNGLYDPVAIFVLLTQISLLEVISYNLFEHATVCTMVRSTLLKIFEVWFDNLIAAILRYT